MKYYCDNCGKYEEVSLYDEQQYLCKTCIDNLENSTEYVINELEDLKYDIYNTRSYKAINLAIQMIKRLEEKCVN